MSDLLQSFGADNAKAQSLSPIVSIWEELKAFVLRN